MCKQYSLPIQWQKCPPQSLIINHAPNLPSCPWRKKWKKEPNLEKFQWWISRAAANSANKESQRGLIASINIDTQASASGGKTWASRARASLHHVTPRAPAASVSSRLPGKFISMSREQEAPRLRRDRRHIAAGVCLRRASGNSGFYVTPIFILEGNAGRFFFFYCERKSF